MLGIAGIGTTLLRLSDPACAPSPALAGIADLAGSERRQSDVSTSPNHLI
jgi:hypothetical protein